MEWFEALILGLLQGLTEYLPVSSRNNGHFGFVVGGRFCSCFCFGLYRLQVDD
jgi:hypothetical protein